MAPMIPNCSCNKINVQHRRFTKALLLITLFTGTAIADEVVLVDGVAADGYTLMVGDKKQWDTIVDSDPISSASGYISVEPDAASGAVNATWNGKGEAQFFLAYSEFRDFSGLLEQDAALVMLLQVTTPPKKKVVIKMGCEYPCAANADISKLLKALPLAQWLKVSIALKCFADGGLNIEHVDTPLLLLTRGKLALSVADVRIVPGIAESATIRCE
jgi:beta-glucosidase